MTEPEKRWLLLQSKRIKEQSQKLDAINVQLKPSGVKSEIRGIGNALHRMAERLESRSKSSL